MWGLISITVITRRLISVLNITLVWSGSVTYDPTDYSDISGLMNLKSVTHLTSLTPNAKPAISEGMNGLV